MKQEKRNLCKKIVAIILMLTVLVGVLPKSLGDVFASETGKATVTIDSRSDTSGASGFWFTVSPEDSLTFNGVWDTYYGSCIYVNGELKTQVPVCKALPNLYYVALSDVGLSATADVTVVKVAGELTDGTHTVEFEPAQFKYKSDGKWYQEAVASDLPTTTVTIDTDSRNNVSEGKNGIWFTVSPSDPLSSASGWDVYKGSIVVNGEPKTDISFCKALPNLYYIALSDAGITPTAGMKVKISGTIDDGTNAVQFTETTFVYQNEVWVIDTTSEEEPPSGLPTTTVTIATDSRNNVSEGKKGIWFTVSPSDPLSSASGWDVYKGSIAVNGEPKTDISYCKALPNLYYIALSDAGITPTAGMKVKISGTIDDGTNAVQFTETTFVYQNEVWVIDTTSEEEPPSGLPTTTVTIATDSRNDISAGKNGIWFTVSPSDPLSSASGWDVYKGSILVNGEPKTDISYCKALPNLYYIALSDAGITPAEGMKVTIKGEINDTVYAVEFTEATFVYKNQVWQLDSTLEDETDYKAAEVKVYDLYELESLSKLTIPEQEGLYNLTNLRQQSNVALRMKIADLDGEVAFGLAKTIANNVWAIAGYQIKVNAEYGFIRVFTMEEEAEIMQTQLTGVDLSGEFTLEFGVADLFLANGGTDVVARRVYVKVNEAEVVSWIDKNVNRELGCYVPAWAQYVTTVESVDYVGYELKDENPNIQDVSELIDGLSTFSTSAGRETKVGAAKQATNNAIRMKVKWNAPLTKEGDELLFSFSNNSKDGIWVGEDGGYNVLFVPGSIRLMHVNDTASVSYAIMDVPKDEFLLEIGTYDRNVYKDDTKVTEHSRVAYVKIDGEEVLTLTDKELGRNLGSNLWVYASKDVKADLVSLTSDKYLIRENVAVSDLYDVTRLSRLSVDVKTEQTIGELKSSTNMAFRTKVSINDKCQELLFALAKTDSSRFWDIDASGWEILLRPQFKQVGIGSQKDGVLSMCGYEFPSEFILEIGERNVRYNDGQPYGRELYVMIDGELVLSYIDKDFSKKIGTYVSLYMTPEDAEATLTSLTTQGYVPVEKNIKATDYYDVSGFASKNIGEGTTYIGDLKDTKNSAIKMRVDVNKDTEEFGISLGKKVTDKIDEDVKDENVSGWTIWIKPTYNTVTIQQGYYKTVKNVTCEIPESFVLEVGSRDAYYENGKYYGYEVYVKINDETVASWIDDNIANRLLGNHVLSYVNGNAKVKKLTFSTLYDSEILPVEYVVNGEKSEGLDAITAETRVVVGKPSKITITTNPAPTYKIENKGVSLNETALTALDIKDAPKGVKIYEVTASKGDKVVVELEKSELTVDEPQNTLNLMDAGGMNEITVPAFGAAPAGNMMLNGERQRTNSAFQFKVTMPEKGGNVRWGIWSDASTSWGYNGFIFGLAPGKVGVYNMVYYPLSVELSDMVAPGKTLYVECGMVKCYEDGVYKYNRLYLKIGESLDKLTQVCWYDTLERSAYGTTISFIGADSEENYTVYSVGTTYSIKDNSSQENKMSLKTSVVFGEERSAVYYPEKIAGYSDVASAREVAYIKLYPKDGKKLSKLIVSGVNVTNKVQKTEDGGYVYELPSVKQNIQFSYTITD